MDDKFENQQRNFPAIAKDIFSALFKSFEKIIKKQMEKQNERIWKLEADKCLLQKQVMSLKHANLQMQNSQKELEQYERRLCLRINGVLIKSEETRGDVLNYVKEIFDEVNWISPIPLLIELMELVLSI